MHQGTKTRLLYATGWRFRLMKWQRLSLIKQNRLTLVTSYPGLKRSPRSRLSLWNNYAMYYINGFKEVKNNNIESKEKPFSVPGLLERYSARKDGKDHWTLGAKYELQGNSLQPKFNLHVTYSKIIMNVSTCLWLLPKTFFKFCPVGGFEYTKKY